MVHVVVGSGGSGPTGPATLAGLRAFYAKALDPGHSPRVFLPAQEAADRLGYSYRQVHELARVGVLRCQWRGEDLYVEPAILSGPAVDRVLASTD